MSDQTLYLIQSSFNATPAMLRKLEQVYAENDAVVLMGEAVLHASSACVQHLKKIYVLENEVENLTPHHLANIHVISYDQFADVVLNFKRNIRLK